MSSQEEDVKDSTGLDLSKAQDENEFSLLRVFLIFSKKLWLMSNIQIERKHLTFRTRIKRLVRKPICFLKLEQMHDIVIGILINRYEFGKAI